MTARLPTQPDITPFSRQPRRQAAVRAAPPVLDTIRLGAGSRVAWIRAVSAPLLLSTDAGVAGPSIARRRTPGPRPERASAAPWRRRPHPGERSSVLVHAAARNRSVESHATEDSERDVGQRRRSHGAPYSRRAGEERPPSGPDYQNRRRAAPGLPLDGLERPAVDGANIPVGLWVDRGWFGRGRVEEGEHVAQAVRLF
jgi:hypothetical protein